MVGDQEFAEGEARSSGLFRPQRVLASSHPPMARSRGFDADDKDRVGSNEYGIVAAISVG